jgi:hypothetical protein
MEHTFTLIFKAPTNGECAFLESSELTEKLTKAGFTNTLVGLGAPSKFSIGVTRVAESTKAAIKDVVAQVRKAIPGSELILIKHDALERARGTLRLAHP